jgi:hypothetical protein
MASPALRSPQQSSPWHSRSQCAGRLFLDEDYQ